MVNNNKKGRKKLKSNMKKVLTIFTMILLTTSIISIASTNPTTQAIDLPTYLLISATPNPIGVGQIVYVNTFLSKPTPTATSVIGDRYEDITIEVTYPDGTKKTLGPYMADPTGGCWDSLVLSQVGEYTLQAKYPGQTLTGYNPQYPDNPGNNLQLIGTVLEASVSKVLTLVVDEDPIQPEYVSPPLPTEYWSRPIYSTNYNWAQLGGNWLGLKGSGFAVSGMYDATGNFQPYTTAPNTGHILWTKPTAFGGQVGAPINADQESQYMSTSIATFCFEPIIIHGVLYYNHYPEMTGSRPSWIAVDLRTGEEIWNIPCGVTGKEFLRYGQVVQFHSVQEYGSNAYLWSVGGTSEWIFGPSGQLTLRLYDPMTGAYIAEIVNGTQNLQMISDFECNEQGTLLGWGTSGNQLYMWNSTRAICYPTGMGSTSQRTYRPSGSIAWDAGIEWSVPRNFSLAGEDTGNLGIGARTAEVILLRSAPTVASQASSGYQITVGIDAKTGTKLWGPIKQTQPEYQSMSLRNARDGVYILHNKDTNEAFGYSLETGEKLWGPVALQGNAWSSIARGVQIAYDKVFIWDFGGNVNALDIKTGEILWTYNRGSSGYDAPYGIYPLWEYSQSVCDGKLFLSEGSLYNPPLHPAKRLVLDCETGEEVWSILSYSSRIPSAHADGMMVQWNSFDKQIYTFGKGQTATTISASPKVLVEGDSVLIEGLVTDESPGTKDSDRIARFPNGVPAIADESMSPWMEYVYMQQPKPTDATGVEVTLTVLDPNGNVYDVATATSDVDGFFKTSFTPQVSGEYTITASFAGSESYWPSDAKTAINVEQAPQPTPEPTSTPAAMTDTYLTGSTIAILAGLGIAVFLLLRKK